MAHKIIVRKNKTNKKGMAPLAIQYIVGKEVVLIGLGYSVRPQDFDEKKQSVKKSCSFHEDCNDKIKDALDRADLITTLYNLRSEELTADKFRDEFSNEMFQLKKDNPERYKDLKQREISLALSQKVYTEKHSDSYVEPTERPAKNNHFEEVWQKYLTYCKTANRATTNSKFQNRFDLLKAFCKSKKLPLSFDSMTVELGYEFKEYLMFDHYNYRTKEKGLTDSTVHNIIKVIKRFLNWSFESGYSKNLDFKKWEIKEPDTDLQYLEQEQLLHLASLSMPKENLQMSLDMWMFMAFTGLRFSDVVNWSRQNVQGDFIKLRTYKTGKKVTIPLNPISRRILEKYNYELSKTIEGRKVSLVPNTKLNDHIKEILRIAGYDKVMVIREKQIRGQIVKEELPLSEAITVHSARRSFMNMMARKFTIKQLQEMTGNTIQNLLVYFKDDEKHLEATMQEFGKEFDVKVA